LRASLPRDSQRLSDDEDHGNGRGEDD
jgi:hypothetical protein